MKQKTTSALFCGSKRASARKKAAFTMIELLFSIVIIGILSVVVLKKTAKVSDVKGAAESFARDLNYLSNYVYNNPRVIFSKEKESVNVARAVDFYQIRFMRPALNFNGKKAVLNKDSKGGIKRLGYMIYKSAVFSKPSKSVKPLRDYVDVAKQFIMPRAGDSHRLYKRRLGSMPPRLDLYARYNVDIDGFLMGAYYNSKRSYNSAKKTSFYRPRVYQLGQASSTKMTFRFYIDPQTGSFIVPEKSHSMSTSAQKSGKKTTVYARSPIDYGGRIILRFTPAGKKASGKDSYCIAINSQTNVVEKIPQQMIKNKEGKAQKEQLAFCMPGFDRQAYMSKWNDSTMFFLYGGKPSTDSVGYKYCDRKKLANGPERLSLIRGTTAILCSQLGKEIKDNKLFCLGDRIIENKTGADGKNLGGMSLTNSFQEDYRCKSGTSKTAGIVVEDGKIAE